MVGFSLLRDEDESGGLDLRFEFQEAVGPAVKDHGGEIVKTSGDGIFAAFGCAVEAAGAALELEKAPTERIELAGLVKVRASL